MPNENDPKLAGLRLVANHIGERLQADLSLKLWDGSVVPLGSSARDDLAFVIRSPGAIRRLLLSPKRTTFFALLASGEFDIEGGTLIEAVHRFDHRKALKVVRGLDKRLILKALWPFLFTRSGGKAPTGFQGVIGKSVERGRDDRQLVQFHYDVSNAFYSTFLGDEMVYSCAYFERPDATLEEAQKAKLDMVCRRLRLKPGERLLDIGCGWGALICHAARHYGVNAVGVTLSKQQFDYVQNLIKAEGLSDRVSVELRDYREVEAAHPPFQKISQIELFEHIGLANHDRHFETIYRLLRPRGLYLHHSCTRRLTRDPRKSRRTKAYQSFLGDFVLPGTELDHIGGTLSALERHGFEVHDVENWREHFMKTAELWAQRLDANRDRAEAIVGYEKTRLWMLFFSIFALAFERNACLIFQTLASRRGVGTSGVPLTRRDLYA